MGDIDILACSERPSEVQRAFTTLPIVSEVLWQGEARSSIVTRHGLQIDLRVLAPEEYGSGLLYFTGSKAHNIALRTLAISRGYKLSEYGLFDRAGNRIASRTEEELYAAFGMDWIPPELRSDQGEIKAALHHRFRASSLQTILWVTCTRTRTGRMAPTRPSVWPRGQSPEVISTWR